MKKVITIVIICILCISTGILACVTYNLSEQNNELEEKIDDLKEKKKASGNDYSSNKTNNSNESSNQKDNNVSKEEKNEQETIKKTDSYSNIKEINLTKLESMLDNKETFILLISQTDCSHCIAFKPVLNSVLKDNKVQAYEIDMQKMTEEEYKSFVKIITIQGTPTTVFIKNGQEETTANRLIGSVSSDKIISRLKSTGYIK